MSPAGGPGPWFQSGQHKPAYAHRCLSGAVGTDRQLRRPRAHSGGKAAGFAENWRVHSLQPVVEQTMAPEAPEERQGPEGPRVLREPCARPGLLTLGKALTRPQGFPAEVKAEAVLSAEGRSPEPAHSDADRPLCPGPAWGAGSPPGTALFGSSLGPLWNLASSQWSGLPTSICAGGL